MKIEAIVSGEIVTIRPDSDIRVKTIIPLRKVFEQLYEKGHTKIAIDLSEVHFIDSSGLGILLNFAKKQKQKGGFLCLYNYKDDVKELLDIVDLGDFIPVFKTYESMKLALTG